MPELTQYESAIKFELDVYNIINSLLSPDEEIRYQFKIKNSRQIFFIDIFLPNGCKKLGWIYPTIIEVKQKINSFFLDRQFNQIKRYAEVLSLTMYCSVYIYETSQGWDNYSLLKQPSQNVFIWSINELKRKIIGNRKSNRSHIKLERLDPIKLIKKTVEESQYTLFLGAGVSMSAQLPSWSQLLQSLLESKKGVPYKSINENCFEDISKFLGYSSIISGRYIIDGFKKSKNSIVARIHDTLYKTYKPSSLVDAICKLINKFNPVQVITYNYDNLIEIGLNDERKFVPVFDKCRLQIGQVPIYHVHGMISKEVGPREMPILSEFDYHKLYNNPCSWPNVVQLQALNSTSCIFIGFSMTDPNQRRLLEYSRNEQRDSEDYSKLPHFVFIKRDVLNKMASKKINEEHWKEQERMMNDFGLNVIWFNDYDELPEIINQLLEPSVEC